MDDPRLFRWLDTIWRDLHEAASERRGEFRNATVASVNEEGVATLRIVVLRSADRASARFRFHTDLRSEKVPQLLAQPFAEMLFWRAADEMQLRCFGRAELALPGTPEARAAFEAIPEEGRRKYRSGPSPGTPIQAPDLLEFAQSSPDAVDPGLARFTLVTFHVSRIDALRLEGARQARALFHLDGDGSTSARWIAP